MTEFITVRGSVGTDPQHVVTTSGQGMGKFRLAANERRLNKESGKWEDFHTNWFSVTGFRELGRNIVASLNKGDRIVVTGRLKINEFQRADGTMGQSADIEADSVGHDLAWGTSMFSRTPKRGERDEFAAGPYLADGEPENSTKGGLSPVGWPVEAHSAMVRVIDADGESGEKCPATEGRDQDADAVSQDRGVA
ncbi:single-stranded DNA-binding protein [Paeniglutamicibacter cryotolerans]|uniref:Single-stranded DNA-binding protein n=1 Tax=Paeniglutamicibacter cryotolerans TaxID=670079 RepID=A0A839QQJ7_9MICC|nr:single-stranded DNA-binding protein [Paeniglutamicibacter cryotolerans]MBB2996915.1 single-strand DNA-binding protein [Paeniglutamicibacter cryotolerans]